MSDNRDDQIDWAALGKDIVESGKHAPKKGDYLGRLKYWGIDVFENSPQEWIDALVAEVEQEQRDEQ